MLGNRSFFAKKRRGGILKVVRQHFLRDDIWSGSYLDEECPEDSRVLSGDVDHYVIIDTNIALHQMDFLEHTAIHDVVVTSTVLEEVKHRNRSVYKRLVTLCQTKERRFYVFSNTHHKDTWSQKADGESPNDYNDRLIRLTAEWYTKRIPSIKIILLSDDSANGVKAREAGITAMKTRQYAASRQDAPQLVDMVAGGDAGGADEEHGLDAPGSGDKRKAAVGDSAGNKRARTAPYVEHLSISAVREGLSQGTYHQGTLRVARYNCNEAFAIVDSMEKDILISGKLNMNRAMDGDVVVIELLPESQWRQPSTTIASKDQQSTEDNGGAAGQQQGGDTHGADDQLGEVGIAQMAPGEDVNTFSVSSSKASPTGRVVGILRRNWRTRGYSGCIQVPDKIPGNRAINVLFAPVERRYPYVRITTGQAATLADKRIIVCIDSWPPDSWYPIGHYVRTIGQIGDRQVETSVILHEFDVNATPFSDAVHACVPPLPWKVTNEHEHRGREDLRHLLVCSVDPPGCKDIDDALHSKVLPNGNIELGVHIADVTHFVKPGTAMDDEACRRATTCYLVERRIDMLPKPLTEDICSLRHGVDRLAFSVLWEVTENAQILSTRFTKSIIRSSAALSYEQAQLRMDDKREQDDITLSLRRINAIAKQLRAARAEHGALQLASPEVKFQLDSETLDPTDVGMYQIREANQMVEEMMLLANITVAKNILDTFPKSALLRRHQIPPPKRFDGLLAAAESVGVKIDCSSSKALAKSLDDAVDPNDPLFNTLIRIMSTRCMMQAQYIGSADVDPVDYLHYGLATQLYTHFTSPIRRYADVVVHRLLMAMLDLEPLPEAISNTQRLREVAANLNERHTNAQYAGRASVELHTLIFFRKKTIVENGRVTRLQRNGLIVFVPKYGIEGPVYFDKNEDGNDLVLNAEKQQICTQTGSVVYKLFQKVDVELSVEQLKHGRERLRVQLYDSTKALASTKAPGSTAMITEVTN